ncbi:catalase, partial [Enterococcus faecalis]
QANALYNLLPSEEKENLINNIAASLGQVKNQEIIARQIDLFTIVNPEYGARVEQAIKQ